MSVLNMCTSVNTLEIVAILLLLINHSNALCEGKLFFTVYGGTVIKAIPSDTLVTDPPPASSLFLTHYLYYNRMMSYYSLGFVQ